jgi:hypothetical protein
MDTSMNDSARARRCHPPGTLDDQENVGELGGAGQSDIAAMSWSAAKGKARTPMPIAS